MYTVQYSVPSNTVRAGCHSDRNRTTMMAKTYESVSECIIFRRMRAMWLKKKPHYDKPGKNKKKKKKKQNNLKQLPQHPAPTHNNYKSNDTIKHIQEQARAEQLCNNEDVTTFPCKQGNGLFVVVEMVTRYIISRSSEVSVRQRRTEP